MGSVCLSSTAFGRYISPSLKNLIFRPVRRTESNAVDPCCKFVLNLNLSRELYCSGWLKSHLFDGAVLQ